MVSPALAAPAAANITILSAGPDGSGDPYNLTVAANDGNAVQIQTMTAHVYSASMQDVANPTMAYNSSLSSGTSDQVWVASPPIAESALPAGTYTVTVDAADGTETDTGLAAPGSFSFTYTTDVLTVTASPPAVTQGSQNVTFAGTLTGSAPGGTPVGIANVPVNLSGAASNPVATTGSNGNFSYPATGVTPGTYAFSIAATSTYPAAAASASVTAQQAATSITVAASPASVTEGEQAVTFSGSVSVTPAPPATQTPTGIGSGVPIYLNGSSTPVTQTTDANGDFSYAASNVQPGSYTFSVTQSAQGLYGSASADRIGRCTGSSDDDLSHAKSGHAHVRLTDRILRGHCDRATAGRNDSGASAGCAGLRQHRRGVSGPDRKPDQCERKLHVLGQRHHR